MKFTNISQKKLVVILGPNAAGKSDVGVKLARKFNGEVISADSRQVYKGMDRGTGKITKKEMMGIPHHLLDVASPKRKFSVARYQNLANKAIDQITRRGKTQFLVGGTPFYIYAVVDNYQFPEVKPNRLLRLNLNKLSVQELFEKLQTLDLKRARTIEAKNPRRLIRALEIVLTTGKPVPKFEIVTPLSATLDVLFIGVKKSPEELKKRIQKRLLKRLKQGMVAEVKKLHATGVSWKRLEEFGLEYRYIAQYLQQKISYQEMIAILQKAIEDFARRQMTWFKRDPRIHWTTSYREAEKLVHEFVLNRV